MYKVYWTSQDGAARSAEYAEMVEALTEANRMRALGWAYVALVGELPNQVGQMGVDSVVDGKLPNSKDYTWKMRRD